MSPRANLTKQTVVQTAADLINAEGLEALSLGRLAKELGIRTPSLVRAHLSSGVSSSRPPCGD